METENIVKFLEEQTNIIKPILDRMSYSYWDASITGKKEDYQKYEDLSKELAKLFNNSENFQRIKQFLNSGIKNVLIQRQLRVLYNSYLSNQGDLKLINEILEKSTALEQKFNTFRANIDGKKMTDNQIKKILKTETDSKKLQEAWESSKTQGKLVAKELIELVKLRNKLAQSLGFKNYYVLSLETSEQKEEDITRIFNELGNLTDKIFEEIKSEIDISLSKKYEVSKLAPWHYQDLFFQEAPEIYNLNLDDFYSEDILGKAVKFYSSIGMIVSDMIEKSDLYEKEGKYQHAYCIDLNREGDVRILTNLKNDYYWMSTVLHELGHAVYDKYVDETLPYLIREKSHILTTEAIALLFERNSNNISFIQKFCDSDITKLNEIASELNKDLKFRELIFSRWAQVMVNFEKNLYENPDQNLNKLWWDLVKKYQLIDFSRDEPDWASKIHLVSAPVYYHNYMIGKLFASQINNYIAKNILKESSVKNLNYSDKKEIGDYLRSKIFSSGGKYEWNDLIKSSTGEELNLNYWINEFC